jgi:uncharacterized protein YndB with AHSA1/START domain
MRYEDGPITEAEVLIEAPIETVWALVTDINLAMPKIWRSYASWMS